MKTNYRKRQPARKSLGVALFLVLAFLALIITLVLAFFSSVSSELTGARSAASGATAKQLGDTAVQVVSSMIRMATSSSSKSVTWASQPGMIRTYGSTTGAASSAPLAYFKLYSSDDMEITQSEIAKFNTDNDPNPDLVTDWDLKPALYTDLNSPVLDSIKRPHFPIIDPRAQTNTGSDVDGFSYSATTAARPGYTPINMGSKVVTDASVADNQRLPMPVKWIYVLKDGTLTAPRGADSTGKIANWTGESNAAKKPSATNPIVGRIAFWTDDESCKVNINTASEGVYWDVPRINSFEDSGRFDRSHTGLAIFQPAKREYNRYPGHPATTCLSPIFGKLLLVTTPYPIDTTSAVAAQLDPYAAIAPRVGLATGFSGGSQGGTAVPTGALTVDTDRLYASVDELMFTPVMSGTKRALGKITKDELEKRKFFLTASSSAPETTLFNTPRISMWPVWQDETKRTPIDKLLSFCSTIGRKNYYLTRSNARSSTADHTTRNGQLFTYLQGRTAAAIPGFGGNFLTKYGVDRDQILTYLYDYIRCVNLSDPSAGATPYTPIFSATAVTTNKDADFYNRTMGAGEVVPIKIPGTTLRGFGRIYSISSAALVFYGTNKNAAGLTDKMRCALLLEFACPMQGMAGMMPNIKFKMLTPGLEAFKAAPTSTVAAPTYLPLGFPAGGTNYLETSDVQTWGGRSIGGTEGPAMGFSNNWNNSKSVATDFLPGTPGKDIKGIYPFVTGQDFTFATPTPTFLFKGGDLTLEIITQDSAEVVQTVHLTFPRGTFKTPGVSAAPSYNQRVLYNPNVGTEKNDGMTGVGRADGSLIQNADTVVALEVAGAKGNANDTSADPTAGDTRMVEGLADVPATRFRPHQKYTTADRTPMAHSLVLGWGGPLPGATLGKLANVLPSYPLQTDVPSRVATGVTRKDGGPGDWDTGMGDQKDGAYINKPDEGDKALPSSNPQHVPYYLGYPDQFQSIGDTFFSPNRQIPSPLMFGSIPTGVQRALPWQTLLFHPRPEDITHPGFGTPRVPASGVSYTQPPDHLIADLFWMPVVEPYAISQPFSTSGKINLNYQIAPFTYINRSTGMHAVMRSTKFLALSLSDGPNYKPHTSASQNTPASVTGTRRRSIDMTKTLADFDEKFKNNDLFRSASQICEMNLVPPEVSTSVGMASSASMAAFWNNNKLTGDNMREKPYVDLYSRLTTKSNVYTVHFRVQVLKKTRATDVAIWDETKDAFLSEHRGSSLIERYIDVSDPELEKPENDFATVPSLSVDKFYKFRVLSTKKF